MSSQFLSSEEYDERAHQLYNEGNYDEALSTLREGLTIYPNAVELHVGVGYARLARDEFAWARRSFEEALILDPDHEDALAGLGETLLKFGQPAAAMKAFRRILELGYQDDVELMLQVGRALFRDGLMDEAKEFFAVALQQAPDHVEAVAMVGYAEHRLGHDEAAIATLRRVLQLDAEFSEARIYLANLLYDRAEYEAALYHFERTTPEDHWDELGIWRLIELRKSTYRLVDGDPSLKAWDDRLSELAAEQDDIDEMLGEIEQAASAAAEQEVRGQLELFGALLADLGEQRQPVSHAVVGRDGSEYDGTWDEIVEQMRQRSTASWKSALEFMQSEARRGFSVTGRLISTADAESFIRGSADAGLLRIVR
ncbi:MAG: tetratricopeptide repeat protein [Gemmatimonadetes bacterium]|nr:tetratricopeptide repeat protein [Gemmatimonadota bacterium]MBI3569109.1 tetratricopeptide repeat protein [Gemmatimonadota bacterium]